MHQLLLKLKPTALLDGQLRLLLSNMGGSVIPAMRFVQRLGWFE